MTSGIDRARRKARHSAGSDVLRLASGITVAQILGLLMAPVYSRLFDAEAFGLSALFASVTIVLGAAVCLGYQTAIMLPDNDREAGHLLLDCLLLSMLVGLLVWGVAPALLRSLRGRQDTDLPTMLAGAWGLVVGITGVVQSFRVWNNRLDRMRPLAWAPIAWALALAAFRLIGAGVGWDGGQVLILSQVVAKSANALVQVGFGLSAAIVHWRKATLSDLWRPLRRWSRFPRYALWGELLNSVSRQVPVFLLTWDFGAETVGLYAMAYRVVGFPGVLLRAAIGQVFLRRATEAHREGNLGSLTARTLEHLVVLGSMGFVAGACVGDVAFGIVFGPDWVPAGRMAQLICLSQWATFLAAPLVNVCVVLERQDVSLGLNLVLLVGRGLMLAFGGMLGGPLLAVGLFVAWGVLVWIGFLGWVLRATDAALHLEREARRNLVRGALLLACCLAARLAAGSDWLVLAVAVAAVTLYYALALRAYPVRAWLGLEKRRA